MRCRFGWTLQGTVKRECIREKCPRTVDEAKRWVGEYIENYNTARLHSATGYVTPLDMLEGRQAIIHAERDRKLAEAREERRQRRQLNYEPAVAQRDGCRVKRRPALRERNRPRDNPAGLIETMCCGTGRTIGAPPQPQKHIGLIDPLCLKRLPPEGRNKSLSSVNGLSYSR